MPSSVINSDDGVISGTSGLKSSGGDDGVLQLQSNGADRLALKAAEVVVNDGGADVDFRVEGDTDANLLFVNAGNDLVGIGTSSPNGKLDIVSSSAGANTNTLFLTNSSGTANTATSLIFGVGSDPTIRNATIRAINDGSNNISLAFLTSAADAPAERIRVTQNGITFNGDTAAANALNDYENGTTDLVVRIGATEIARQTNGLRYIKIGAFVFITCTGGGISNFAKGANSGNLRVDLPFAVPSGNNSTGTVRYEGFSPTAGTITIVSMANSNSSYAIFQMFSTGGYLDNITNSTLNATATIYDFTLCYYTTA